MPCDKRNPPFQVFFFFLHSPLSTSFSPLGCAPWGVKTCHAKRKKSAVKCSWEEGETLMAQRESQSSLSLSCLCCCNYNPTFLFEMYWHTHIHTQRHTGLYTSSSACTQMHRIWGLQSHRSQIYKCIQWYAFRKSEHISLPYMQCAAAPLVT